MIVEPPGEPSGQERLAVALDDRRRHRAARPLAALRPVGVRRGVEVEVRQLVVEQEPVARHDDAVAAGRLDRERVGDDVAVAVGHREVGRRLARVRDAGRPRAAAPLRWSSYGLPRRRSGCARRAAPISGAALVGERRPTAGRAAARRRTPGRPGRRCGRRTRAARPRGSGAGSRRASAPSGEKPSRMFSASPTVEPPLDGGPMPKTSGRGSVLHAARARARCSAAGRRSSSARAARCGSRRAPPAAGSPPRRSPPPPGRGRSRARAPSSADPLVRPRHVRVAERRADVARRAVRVEVERARGRDVVEVVLHGVDLVEERLVDREALARDPDAGLAAPPRARSCRSAAARATSRAACPARRPRGR